MVIPRVLRRIGSGMPVRPVAPGKSSGIALLVAGGLVVVAYVVMLPVTTVTALPTGSAIPLAFAMALIGLFLCVTGRDALGHILGFLVFENGIFGWPCWPPTGCPASSRRAYFSTCSSSCSSWKASSARSGASTSRSTRPRLRELRG